VNLPSESIDTGEESNRMNKEHFLLRLCWVTKRAVFGNRYRQLFKTIRKNKPTHILEIGTWNGNNAVKMLQAAAKSNPGATIHYYGFDLFQDMTEDVYAAEISKRPPSLEEVKKILLKTGNEINLFKGDTNITLPEVLPTLPPVDFIFIDGGHSVSTITNDWNNISRYISNKSIVIFDDYWKNRPKEGCKPILDALDPQQYTVQILPIVDKYFNRDFGKLFIALATVQKTGELI